jgi:hypothetical protein
MCNLFLALNEKIPVAKTKFENANLENDVWSETYKV